MRQFIPYTEKVAIGPSKAEPKSTYCYQCNIPLSQPIRGCLCDVCWGMLEAVSTPYFVTIQREWTAENVKRMDNKFRMLQGDMEDGDDSTQAGG